MLSFCQYNDQLRAHRKNLARIIGTSSLVTQYNKVQEAEVGHFLLHLLTSPEKFLEHMKKCVWLPNKLF